MTSPEFDMSEAPASRRAPRMAPDDRRHAILEAVAPVVVERGLDVSTRELADAAGVAEGTLYRVFADKRTLVAQALMLAWKTHVERTVAPPSEPIDLTLPLRDRVTHLVDLASSAARESLRLLTLLHDLAPEDLPGGDHGAVHPPRPGAHLSARQEQISQYVAHVLGADAELLSVPIGSFVTIVRMLVMARGAPGGLASDALSDDTIVDVLLSGVFSGSHGSRS